MEMLSFVLDFISKAFGKAPPAKKHKLLISGFILNAS
jgi:hypothetical protein